MSGQFERLDFREVGRMSYGVMSLSPIKLARENTVWHGMRERERPREPSCWGSDNTIFLRPGRTTPRSISFSLAARMRPATLGFRPGHGRSPAKHPRGHPAMTKTITSKLVEAFALCPRKAFLLMTGVTASPGPHDYEVVIREQAEVNKKAHRARLAEGAEVAPFGGLAEMATGREIVSDADLTADGLHACCDFLTKVIESSRLGRFSYEPVKVIGTFRASRQDISCAGLRGSRPRRSAEPAAVFGHACSARRPPRQGEASRQVQGGAADRRCPAGLGGQLGWRRSTGCAEQALPELPVPRRLPAAGGEGGQPEPAGPDDAEADAEVS